MQLSKKGVLKKMKTYNENRKDGVVNVGTQNAEGGLGKFNIHSEYLPIFNQ